MSEGVRESERGKWGKGRTASLRAPSKAVADVVSNAMHAIAQEQPFLPIHLRERSDNLKSSG